MLFPMPAGMSILGAVTAADCSAIQAGAEMDPGVSLGDTLIADGGTWFDDRGQIVQVATGFSGHHPPLITLVARNVAGYKF